LTLRSTPFIANTVLVVLSLMAFKMLVVLSLRRKGVTSLGWGVGMLATIRHRWLSIRRREARRTGALRDGFVGRLKREEIRSLV